MHGYNFKTTGVSLRTGSRWAQTKQGSLPCPCPDRFALQILLFHAHQIFFPSSPGACSQAKLESAASSSVIWMQHISEMNGFCFFTFYLHIFTRTFTLCKKCPLGNWGCQLNSTLFEVGRGCLALLDSGHSNHECLNFFVHFFGNYGMKAPHINRSVSCSNAK